MNREQHSKMLDHLAENPVETAETLRAFWTEHRGGIRYADAVATTGRRGVAHAQG